VSQNLDPRFTFDAFVIGPANRLAAAAARKAAEAPGKVYNPLFIYSGSGLGKTHLLGAILNAVEQLHARSATYETTPHLLEVLSGSADAGEPGAPSSPDATIMEASHRLLQQQLGFSRDPEFEPLELIGPDTDPLELERPETDPFDVGPLNSTPPPAAPGPSTPERAPPAPASSLRARFRDVSVLLLDDVQFLAGEREVQEDLLRTLDMLTDRGAQVVLTSDRPPSEIDGLDDRLLTRLSGGLIVDIGTPDFDTKVAIARRKARDRGVALAPDTFRTLARAEFSNVRELQGALNRLIAVQELEEREVKPEEVPRLLGRTVAGGSDELRDLLVDVEPPVAATGPGDRRVAAALLKWESKGFKTRRLDTALSARVTAAQADQIVERYERDVKRLQQVVAAIRKLEPEAPELADDVLRDPGRVEEAKALLVAVRKRAVPPPAPPSGPGLEQVGESGSLAVRAVRAVIQAPGRAYNPLYVQGPTKPGRALLVALAQALAEKGLTVAFNDSVSFAEEHIRAVEQNRLDDWRARYRRAEALFLTGLDQLAGLAQGHDELFHLFETFHGQGHQLVFSSVLPPKDLILPPRIQSRLAAGLVVELESAHLAPRAPATQTSQSSPAPPDREAKTAPAEPTPSTDHRNASDWILSPEKVLLEWPDAMDWIQESPG
jgi:chromosomal replication initiation ATPase DnaA